MKKSHLVAMLQQLQRQNMKLKDEVIVACKELSKYESIMMDQLSKVGKMKAVYQSPTECLADFAKQYESILADGLNNSKLVDSLQFSLKESERKNRELVRALADIEMKNAELLENNRFAEQKRLKVEKQLKMQLQEMTRKQKKVLQAYDQMVKEHDIRQMQREEEKRGAISAAVASAKQQMIEYRNKVHEQFRRQSQILREEIKSRDESFKKLAKNFSKMQQRSDLSESEATKINGVLDKILKFEQLNQVIRDLRQQNSLVKKGMNDANNKKLSLEIRLSQLRTEIMNHESRYKRKQIEYDQLNKLNQQITVELEREKNGNKTLQNYYEQKWIHEFERVKKHLEKTYQEKIAEHRQEVELKKSEIGRRIQSYIFLHAEDEKAINELKKTISEKQKQRQVLIEQMQKLGSQIRELKSVMNESNKMIIESQCSYELEIFYRAQKLKSKIQELQSKNEILILQNEKVQIIMKDVQSDFNHKLQEKKEEILVQQQLKIQLLVKSQKLELKQIQKHFEEQIQKMQMKEKILKQEYEQKLVEAASMIEKVRQQKQQQMQQQRKVFKESIGQLFKKQKALRREFEVTKSQLEEKIKFLEIELQNKKSNLKFEVQMAEKDHVLKKQLSDMIQKQMKENKQLLKEKTDLKNELQAKESEINYLSHELEESKFTKSDWLRLTNELKEMFFFDLQELNSTFVKQSNILKSKIWELQNIILCRPIRPKDVQRIRQLSEKQRELQSMVELKEAENVVLKQLKQYYQQKNDIVKHTSEGQMNIFEQRKTPSVLIITKKHKKARASHFQLASSQMGNTSDVQQDVKRMKHYIASKFRQSALETRGEKGFTSSRLKTIYNPHRSIDK